MLLDIRVPYIRRRGKAQRSGAFAGLVCVPALALAVSMAGVSSAWAENTSPETVTASQRLMAPHSPPLAGTQPAQAATNSVPQANRCPTVTKWETLWGAQWHATVDFRPSDLCNGRNVKRAYVRLKQYCWPYNDSGRVYTATASSPRDSRVYRAYTWVWDSPNWGCITEDFFGYELF